ncbi:MAG: hypothetical protein ACREJ0_06245, partial [Geminicoccaceae bacterium]
MRTAVEVHPTRYLQDILQIVDCIYAAACGETPWGKTIAEICRIGKLDGCALGVVDGLERRRLVLASCGPSPTAKPNAMLGPIPGDPQWADRLLRSAAGAVWLDRQIM